MKKLALLVFLVGCGTSEEETGTVALPITLNAGQAPGCAGNIALVMSRPTPGADLAVTGSWSCGNYNGAVSGVWPAGSETMNLVLATTPGATIPATAKLGWVGLSGTAHVNGADVPLASSP